MTEPSGSFAMGDIFPSMEEARQAFKCHMEKQGLPYKVKKGESTRYVAGCRADDQCEFYVRIYWRANEQNAIVSTYGQHTCSASSALIKSRTTSNNHNETANDVDPSESTSHSLRTSKIYDSSPFEVGDTFPTLKEAQNALARHLRHRELSYKIKKSEPARFVAVCPQGADSCSFYVRIAWRWSEQIAEVATYRPHICKPEPNDSCAATSTVNYLSAEHHVDPNLQSAGRMTLRPEQENVVTLKQARKRTRGFVTHEFGPDGRQLKRMRIGKGGKLRGKDVGHIGDQNTGRTPQVVKQER